MRDLNEYVQGCISELNFNLDDFGISDWEDRSARREKLSSRRRWMVGRYIMQYLGM
jgi:hypothetical protein